MIQVQSKKKKSDSGIRRKPLRKTLLSASYSVDTINPSGPSPSGLESDPLISDAGEGKTKKRKRIEVLPDDKKLASHIDIDDLFNKLNRTKKETKLKAEKLLMKEEKEAKRALQASQELVSEKGEKFRFKSPEAPLERYDRDSGLPVYKAHLLEVGGGGGTALCPFDCNCCF